MKFDDLEFGPRSGGALPGTAALVFFPNGYGASVIRGLGSYGEEEGLWELGVMVGDEQTCCLTYDTPVTSDVLGHLDEAEVTWALEEIEALPAAPGGAVQKQVADREETRKQMKELMRKAR